MLSTIVQVHVQAEVHVHATAVGLLDTYETQTPG
jgi:hypothetical protein